MDKSPFGQQICDSAFIYGQYVVKAGPIFSCTIVLIDFMEADKQTKYVWISGFYILYRNTWVELFVFGFF